MGWLGKVVGGTIGFALGGPLGAVAGAVFGHAFDRSEDRRFIADDRRLSETEAAQFQFFLGAFSMLAKLVQADGRVAEEEVDQIRRFMAHDLGLSPDRQQVALNIFHAALDSPGTFADFTRQFYDRFRYQPQLLELMVDIMLRVSLADGRLNDTEERLIHSAVMLFGFSEARYASIKSRYVQEAAPYYAVLGAVPDDSDDMIKKRYRKLVQEYHPDKIAAKGLPEEFTRFAEKKFREIQEAYTQIKKERHMR